MSGTEPYSHDVPHSHRSGMRIEPLISLQWFCDMEKLAGPAIAAANDGSLRFHPERPHTQVYLDWLENIRPWCISRQLWWGHQIPVWYRGEETLRGRASRPRATAGSATRTCWTPGSPRRCGRSRPWAGPSRPTSCAPSTPPTCSPRPGTSSSSGSRGWSCSGSSSPASCRSTDVPIHSTILAPDGQRMSKSLGTGHRPARGDRRARRRRAALRPAGDGVEPGRAATRPSACRQGRDLANKLWNASRLILLGVEEGAEPSAGARRDGRGPLDPLAPRAGHRSARRADRGLRALGRHARAVRLLLVRAVRLVPRAGQAAPLRRGGDRAAVSATLLYALDRMLRLLHPVMPHVTEEIWSFMPAERGLLAVADWPEAEPVASDEDAEAGSGARSQAITDLRRYREQAGVKPSAVAARPARRPRGTRGPRRRWRGWRGWSWRGRRRRPGRRGAGARRRRAAAARRRLRPRGRGPPHRGPARAARRGDRAAGEASWPTRGSWSARPPRWLRASASKLAGSRQALASLEGVVTAREAEEYLLGLELFGMRFGLDRMHKLMTALGMPQRRFASIHVVGSNGKSSTVRFIAAILERHGLRTGSYTSPHLRSFRERVEVGEEPVDARSASRRRCERAAASRGDGGAHARGRRRASPSSRRSPPPPTTSWPRAGWRWRWWRPGSAGATTPPT